MLGEVLQDLCPRCGADWLDGARVCPACGFDRIGLRAPSVNDTGRGVHLRPMDLALLTLAMVALLVVAVGAGWRLGSTSVAVHAPQPAAAGSRAVVPVVVVLVVFAERLGDSLELEAYRTQFSAGDTIAWRAELPHPPPAAELTVVIAWQSIRERMQLSEETVTLRDAELAIIGRDEVPLDDLVPTAGLSSVTYYAGDAKLAEGIFEVLPPDR